MNSGPGLISMQMECRLELGRRRFCWRTPSRGRAGGAGSEGGWSPGAEVVERGVHESQGEAAPPPGGFERGLGLSETGSLQVPSQNREGQGVIVSPQASEGISAPRKK